MFAGGYCDDEDDNDDGDADVIREITTLLIVKVNETCYMLSLARIEDGSIYTCVPPVLLQKQMGKCILLLCYWNILSFSSVPLERCLGKYHTVIVFIWFYYSAERHLAL